MDMFLQNFISELEKINDKLNSVVWGPMMLILMISIGIYFTIRLKFFQVRKFKSVIKETIGNIFDKSEKSKDGISPFKSATTALAGTIGTGNIVGVSTALVSGGVGAVFWMWVSSFFGMMTKYAEIVLALHYRQRNDKGEIVGGPMYYIEKGLGQKWLAILFSIFCAIAGFGIGNMTQINSMSESLNIAFGVDKLVVGIVVAVVVGLVIIGGVKRISNVTATIIPVFGILYIVGALVVIFVNIEQIPNAFLQIFKQAFNFQSVGGGVFGYGIMKSMQYGFSRGVFSNEAGLGSAPIAHSASNAKTEVHQGLWGIFEVFFDTIVMCTLTALVIITSGVLDSGLNGANLTTVAFSKVFGDSAFIILSVSISLFAFATLIGWCYYGEKSVEYLFKNSKSAVLIYRFIYIILIVVGAVMQLDLVWNISDTMNGFMAIPNLVALVCLSKKVITITKKYENKI